MKKNDRTKKHNKQITSRNAKHSPVVLIKLTLIQYTFGIRSMMQTIKETEVNNEFRCYIGYGLSEAISHLSTFSKNYTRLFEGTSVFEEIFQGTKVKILATVSYIAKVYLYMAYTSKQTQQS